MIGVIELIVTYNDQYSPQRFGPTEILCTVLIIVRLIPRLSWEGLGTRLGSLYATISLLLSSELYIQNVAVSLYQTSDSYSLHFLHFSIISLQVIIQGEETRKKYNTRGREKLHVRFSDGSDVHSYEEDDDFESPPSRKKTATSKGNTKSFYGSSDDINTFNGNYQGFPFRGGA